MNHNSNHTPGSDRNSPDPGGPMSGDGVGESEHPTYIHPQQSNPSQGYPHPAANPYGNPPQPGFSPARRMKERNILGIMALVAAVLGTACACIPGILVAGWILLPVAFILGIVSLFLSGRAKWPGIAAIILSVIGTIVGVVVFFAVVANAFSDAEGSVDSSAPSSASTSSSDAAGPDASDDVHFSDTYKWNDGLTITVAKPQAFTPSQEAGTGESKGYKFRKFKITVHNGTKDPVDAGAISDSVQSGGQQGEIVVDSGIEPAVGKIQPGKSLTYTIGYGVKDPSDISMDLTAYVGDDYKAHEVTFKTD